MDEQRVEEILNAYELIQVHYRGIPVYIEELHDNQTATVFPLDEMHHVQRVDLAGLEEIQSTLNEVKSEENETT
jgi:small acid-soluble spore protein H (minor)